LTIPIRSSSLTFFTEGYLLFFDFFIYKIISMTAPHYFRDDTKFKYWIPAFATVSQ